MAQSPWDTTSNFASILGHLSKMSILFLYSELSSNELFSAMAFHQHHREKLKYKDVGC